MAAAYAAIVSVLHINDKIKQHHAPHIKSLGENPLINALHETAISLQNFLETYDVGQDLVSRIAGVAYAAEDVLESHIVDCIHAIKEEMWIESLWERRSSQFNQSLEKVIQDMDFIIKQEVKHIKLHDIGKTKGLHPSNTSPVVLPGSSSAPPKPSADTHMVGFDEYLIQLLEKLVGKGTNRQIIPIFGMGGIGKTTLAKNVLVNSRVIQQFKRRAWVKISQQYNVRKIFSDLLFEISGDVVGQDIPEDKLGERLHKKLWNRRYLIILDDMWSLEAWELVSLFLPENDNGSRIIITTRITTLVSDFGSSGIKLDLLDHDQSWNLFCKKVFGDEVNFQGGDELKKLGRKIVRKCKRLPLSIVTIGGLLAKSQKTREYWEYVFGNLNSKVNSDDNEHCLNILSLSYSHLPIHLKPCFLYMGLLPEDVYIPADKLVDLWIAEGFLKPDKAKSLKEVANDYLYDLIDRNLIDLRDNLRHTRKVNRCGMHDLLRDICLREAQKDKFLFLVNNLTNPNIENQRRLAIDRGGEDSITEDDAFGRDLYSPSRVRSFKTNQNKIHLPRFYGLLRVLDAHHTFLGLEVFEHVNLRYLYFSIAHGVSTQLPSSINLMWNLESLNIAEAARDKPIVVPVEFWDMPRLRFLWLHDCGILPQPPNRQSYNHENGGLEEIGWVINFKFSEDVIRRTPNINHLEIECRDEHQGMMRSSHDDDDDFCVVKNLHRLIKLETLTLFLYGCPHSLADNWEHQINFPYSLKILALFDGKLPWESMAKFASLPHLEELHLHYEAFAGEEWNLVEYEEQKFPSLKLLDIDGCPLEWWIAESTCFPRLERLLLKYMDGLQEIPIDIGNIPTLEFIYVKRCSQGVIRSAEEIYREQQENYGNGNIEVYISEDTDDSDATSDDDGNESEEESDYASDAAEDRTQNETEDDSHHESHDK